MFDGSGLLVTGGSGLLGGELVKRLPLALFPPSGVFNVVDYEQMTRYSGLQRVSTVLHAAAFTSPPKVDQDPVKAISINIIGTANVARLCIENSLKLVYVSTDYVFKGDRGSYTESDGVQPINKYAWSKLGGECAVRMHDRSLIIRTSFGPKIFPYPKAFSDQWTSRESVDIIAEKIVMCLELNLEGVIHLGGERRSVLEYARHLDVSREIQPLQIADVPFQVPRDTSLDVSRFEQLIRTIQDCERK